MTKFELGTLRLKPAKDMIKGFMDDHGVTRKQAKHLYNALLNDEVWINDTYQVNITWNSPNHAFGDVAIIHLSIKRRDRQIIHDWRDLQEIKNELVGPEFEAIELYPAESRRVDTANQYHLWVMPKGEFVSVGWNVRMVSGESKFGAVQREFEDSQQ